MCFKFIMRFPVINMILSIFTFNFVCSIIFSEEKVLKLHFIYNVVYSMKLLMLYTTFFIT